MEEEKPLKAPEVGSGALPGQALPSAPPPYQPGPQPVVVNAVQPQPIMGQPMMMPQQPMVMPQPNMVNGKRN